MSDPPAIEYVLSSAKHLRNVVAWLEAGRGMKKWVDLELTSSPRPDLLTPADHESPPRICYGDPVILEPKQIEVWHRTYVKIPEEWNDSDFYLYQEEDRICYFCKSKRKLHETMQKRLREHTKQNVEYEFGRVADSVGEIIFFTETRENFQDYLDRTQD